MSKNDKTTASGQLIKLLTPDSDFAFVEVVRNPDWFTFEDGDTLGDDQAILRYQSDENDIETLGDVCLVLSVVVYQDSDPMSWFFSLNHEAFPNSPLCEWECDVPDSSIPEVRIECNQSREFKAKWVEDDALSGGDCEDEDDDEGEEWKNA